MNRKEWYLANKGMFYTLSNAVMYDLIDNNGVQEWVEICFIDDQLEFLYVMSNNG